MIKLAYQNNILYLKPELLDGLTSRKNNDENKRRSGKKSSTKTTKGMIWTKVFISCFTYVKN